MSKRFEKHGKKCDVSTDGWQEEEEEEEKDCPLKGWGLQIGLCGG